MIKVRKIKIAFVLGLLFGISLFKAHYVFATTYTSTNFGIKDPVLDDGAGFTSSSNYGLNASVGQDAQGVMTSTNYIIKTGFQYYDYGFNAPYITFALTGGTISFGVLTSNGVPETIGPLTPLVNPAYNSTGTTITVGTNAVYGYSLYAQEDHDLQYSTATIPAIVGGSTTTSLSWPNNVTPSSSGVYGLGYNATGVDAGSFNGTCTQYCFKQFSSGTATLVASTSTITNGSGDNTNITYQLAIPTTQSAGTYTNHILYSVVPKF